MNEISFAAYEAACAKHEREVRRMLVALVISILITFVTNLAWLYAWTRYDYETTTETRVYSQDGQGVNIIGEGNSYGEQPAGAGSDHNNHD